MRNKNDKVSSRRYKLVKDQGQVHVEQILPARFFFFFDDSAIAIANSINAWIVSYDIIVYNRKKVFTRSVIGAIKRQLSKISTYFIQS